MVFKLPDSKYTYTNKKELVCFKNNWRYGIHFVLRNLNITLTAPDTVKSSERSSERWFVLFFFEGIRNLKDLKSSMHMHAVIFTETNLQT